MHGEESQFCRGTNIISKCSLEHKCPVAKTKAPNQPPGDPEGYGVASGLSVERDMVCLAGGGRAGVVCAAH